MSVRHHLAIILLLVATAAAWTAPVTVESLPVSKKLSANVNAKSTRLSRESSLFDRKLQNAAVAAQYTTQAELDLRPCLVVRFYDKQANALPLLLLSLFASAHPHLKALVIDTGKKPYEKLPGLLRRVNRASGKKWVHVYDKKTSDVRSTFPDFTHEDYGYVLTDMALEDILRQKEAGSGGFQCDTLTFTNADNIYSPNFIPSMLKSIVHDGKDVVASHFVSHYNYSAERSTRSFNSVVASEIGCGTLRSGEDAEFVTSERFLPCCVELGSVMITTSAVARARIRFLIDKLRKDGTGNSLAKVIIPVAETSSYNIGHLKPTSPNEYLTNADGFFFYRLVSHPNTSSDVIRRVLLLHL